MNNKSVKERLKEKGYKVTDIKGKSLGLKMIKDKDGNNVGFLSPLQCIERLIKNI